MRGAFSVTDPERVEMTLTLTMPLRDWRDIARQLTNDYPSWKLGAAINSMIHHAHQSFTDQIEVKP